jgi:hypothetical protein
MHTSGEWLKGRLPLLPVKADPQAQGSAITYARRYSLSAIVGLCTEEDDDAEQAMDRGKAKLKEEPVKEAHWCSTHQTAFFKRGRMKGYAHPIKDDFGGDTSEWCNEVKVEPVEQTMAPEPKAEKETIDFSEEKPPETKTITKVQNVAELKGLMAKHKIGTRDVLEILAIKSFMEIVDPDEAWTQIKGAKKID